MSHRTRVRHQRPHTVPDQRALLVAATRRTPVCDPRDEELTIVRIPTGGPRTTHPIPQPPPYRVVPTHPLGTAAPLLPGHAHADTVLDQLRAETRALDSRPADEHVTHHQVPREWLCTVPLVDPIAALCDEIELMIARFACAVSDLAVLPGGARLLTSLMAAYAAGPLSAYDHRPLAAPVGRELRAPSGCCPECGGRFELDKGKIPTHYPTGDPRPCRGVGSDPEGSAR